jgi:sec-independent protein translocase protein TatA
MGNLSMWEMLLIFLAILLLFGAKRIPEIAGSFGKGIKEFKRSLTDVERQITEPEPRDRLREGTAADPARRDRTGDDDRPAPKRLIG